MVACGRTELPLEVPSNPPEVLEPRPEVCNGVDDDFNGIADDPFIDDAGLYVSDAHCGGCAISCNTSRKAELTAECQVRDGVPLCVATSCAPGFALSATGRCYPRDQFLCLPCATDDDCGPVVGARCFEFEGSRHCTFGCEHGCPDGYQCGGDADEGLVCEPIGGSCLCEAGQTFDFACALQDPEGNLCAGAARCDDGVLSSCLAPADICDGADNDCSGVVDDDFVDERGIYSVDVHNCGACGIDCTVDVQDLVCGGDPFAPSCVLHCPDLDDGTQPGDFVDADRDIATGCECELTTIGDDAGPVFAEGQDLDTNCDGADGIVTASIYVAPDGQDTHIGSPTRPLATLARAVRARCVDYRHTHTALTYFRGIGHLCGDADARERREDTRWLSA